MQTVDFKIARLQDGQRILDLGCGEGRHALFAYHFADVESVGVDLCYEDVHTTSLKFRDFEEPENGRKSLQLCVADAGQLPFSDASFDRVICSEVLEHIPDYQAVLGEINRVLKPGGIFVASVPRFGPEQVCWWLSDDYHEVEGGHVRIFRRRELQRAIEKQGMVFFHRHWAHALHVPYWWLKCLFWKDRENSVLVRWYHRLLVWDLMKQPALTRIMDRVLNPLMGKSIVLYFVKGLSQ